MFIQCCTAVGFGKEMRVIFLFLQHHVVHIGLGRVVVVDPEKREICDLEELLVRVLLVYAQGFEAGLGELAHE